MVVGEERRGGGRDAVEDSADHLVGHQAPVDEHAVRPAGGGGGGGGGGVCGGEFDQIRVWRSHGKRR